MRKSGRRSSKLGKSKKNNVRLRQARCPPVVTIAISGSLDGHSLEALRLEVNVLPIPAVFGIRGIEVETVDGRLLRRHY